MAVVDSLLLFTYFKKGILLVFTHDIFLELQDLHLHVTRGLQALPHLLKENPDVPNLQIIALPMH